MFQTQGFRLLTLAIAYIAMSRVPLSRIQNVMNAESIENGATVCRGRQQTTGCTVDHKTDEETWSIVETLRDYYEDYSMDCNSKPNYVKIFVSIKIRSRPKSVFVFYIYGCMLNCCKEA
jgi:hypothetical protein